MPPPCPFPAMSGIAARLEKPHVPITGPTCGHHMSNPVRLELLREGALLLHVGALTVPERTVNGGGAPRVDAH